MLSSSDVGPVIIQSVLRPPPHKQMAKVRTTEHICRPTNPTVTEPYANRHKWTLVPFCPFAVATSNIAQVVHLVRLISRKCLSGFHNTGFDLSLRHVTVSTAPQVISNKQKRWCWTLLVTST